MKAKNLIWGIVLLALASLYTWYEANRPGPVDWSESYSPQDKIPYGTYIAYRSLSELFPTSTRMISRLSVLETLQQDDSFSGSWIFIGPVVYFDPVETEHLLEWVAQGHQLFVAAESMPDSLLNKCSLSVEYEDGESRLLVGPEPEKVYTFTSRNFGGYFVLPPDFSGESLGVRTENGQPDFIRFPYGKGQVCLNLNPKAFTNRWILDTLQGDYYYKALSSLSDDGRPLRWDAYQTLGRETLETPFREILRYPSLKMALYLLLFMALCYVFFRARREQRPIPVIRPPENRMLAFLTTVSSLYYRQKDHRIMALKQIDFFLGEVRSKYHGQIQVLDEEFVRLLSERSGVSLEETAALIRQIRQIRDGQEVREADLRNLVRGTELLMKKIK